ncbi:uncharacterized protein J4E84_007887 [Alternaria hordeiaustralica]|uniref:uncharacterized protein n=1 Tax=Alternaria hordeiaustralica TaxID=1187925 RepID=UPI0020C4FC51|nr:uncharacterized protein J4E84_007887 [Alternaria hordeiaustralica]KAI4680747.1 hypothetical protein J4E84_007887 [Alternaria hordeiaustralica]
MRLTPTQPPATGDSAPPSAPNYLLALPRELRDIIYEYALTEDNGLLLFERRTLGEPYSSRRIFEGRRPTDPDVESNRLKYVCRQLYHETKGLGLKLNVLAMQSKRQVEGFVAHMHANHAVVPGNLRQITVRINDDRVNPIPSHIRMFPGVEPGHVIHPVFDEDSLQRYGEEHLKICAREFEKWQREGI